MRRLLPLLLLLLAAPLTARAQQVPIKTIPVAEGDQFLLFPSQNLAMGGVSLAVDDPLLDPFVNPARGMHLDGYRFTGAPVFYHLGDGLGADGGGGRTLPFGLMTRRGRLFGGAALVWQELVMAEPRFVNPLIDFAPTTDERLVTESGDLSRTNHYAFGTVGMTFPRQHLSVGVSALVAGLDAVEGVRLLYADGNAVRQDGGLSQLRLGLHYDAEDGRQADLLVTRHRFHMEHTMQRWVWNAETGSSTFQTRLEQDETRGWAVQAGYRHPLRDGWRAGVQATGDWKHHPKIPNYDLMQIPRDPGNSSAYRVGLGVARTYAGATLGADLLYEPIWSHTWADAAAPTETAGGHVIPTGEMTVENFFRFHNVVARMGFRQAGDRFDFSMGLHLHRIRYALDQTDFVEVRQRHQEERWTEVTPSAGFGVQFPAFQLRYLGRVTLGTGRPGTVGTGIFAEDALAMAGGDYVVAPNGALTLRETRVWTHQITLLLPLGGALQ